MNSMYHGVSPCPPDQNSQRQENHGRDVSRLQYLNYGAPSPEDTLRTASVASSRTLSTHASNISLQVSSASAASAASHTSTGRAALEPLSSQAAAGQQYSMTPNADKSEQSDDDKEHTSNIFQRWHWKFETFLLLLSVCSLIAIVVILAVEDDTTLSSWNFFFSLNTVISVLGTISRASIASSVGSCLAQEKWNFFRKRNNHLYLFDRFDSASRGPFGGLKLLYWLKIG